MVEITKLRNSINKLNEDLKIAKKFFKFPYFCSLNENHFKNKSA